MQHRPDDPRRRALTREWAMHGLTLIRQCRRGGTAIEYALVASLIAIAAIAGMNNLGNKLGTMYSNVSSDL
jgi:pilus assembly protein Flp/PilA